MTTPSAPSASVAGGVPIHANGIGSEGSGRSGGGVRQQHHGFKPPATPVPGMLGKEVAQAAALKYKKDQSKIQKACAKLDPAAAAVPKKTAGCYCTVM